MHTGDNEDAFSESRGLFEQALRFMGGETAASATHGELEDRLATDGRELLRQLYQDHLDLRAGRETRLESVVAAHGGAHRAVEAGHTRTLTTIFGEVRVSRMAYRRRGHENLHPSDAALNLPTERHSHGLRLLAAVESSRGSFDAAAEAIDRGCGQKVGKRQVEQLTQAAAVDFEEFYAAFDLGPADPGDVVVLSVDGKGIVMRPDALRPATGKAAAKATNKLAARLSKGEKRNRKRMAEVGAVYELTPKPRKPGDILATSGDQTTPAPKAANKWVTASVAQDAAQVIAHVFDEAERRDPGHQRTWVALVDGNAHQIERITAEAKARGVTVTIVIDFIHVLEYLWSAAWSFHAQGDTDAETWVHNKAVAILEGNARQVATSIRRKATTAKLDAVKRKGADTCATYLTNKAEYLDYPQALETGWPIATGVIEGTCRYLVADRMDITGARWSVPGAEAVLKLRALRSNNDFQEYWTFHLTQERQRVHKSRYANSVIPNAA